MRFGDRRGKLSKMLSDHGRVFIGADREFNGFDVAWNKERIEENLLSDGIRL